MGTADRINDVRVRLAALRLHYASGQPPVDPGPLEERSGQWIQDTLAAAIPKFGEGVNRWPMDSRYWLCSQDGMAAIIQADYTDAKDYWAERYDCPTIQPPLAWAFGLFFADGSCGSGGEGKRWWSLTNTKPELLERCKAPLSDEFPDFEFEIKSYQSERVGLKTNLGGRRHGLYHLEAKLKERHNNGTRDGFQNDFWKMFYLFGQKKTPSGILEGTISSKTAYLEGVIAGDGHQAAGRAPRIGVQGKSSAAEIYKLAADVGWRPRIYPENRCQDHFYVALNWQHRHDGLIAEAVQQLGECDADDITAHVGCDKGRTLRVLNRLEAGGYVRFDRPWSQRRGKVTSVKEWPNACENFAFTFKALVDRVYGLNQVGLVIDWSGGHGYNVIVFADGEVWFFEPQNDQTVSIGTGIYKMERADILI